MIAAKKAFRLGEAGRNAFLIRQGFSRWVMRKEKVLVKDVES